MPKTPLSCSSFAAGHHLYYLTLNSNRGPIVPAEVTWVRDHEYEVTVNGTKETWFHHSPTQIKQELATSVLVESIEGKPWLFISNGRGTSAYGLTRGLLDCCSSL